ncbi:MAG: hypothetical protein BTM33_01720 [Synechococcus sp. Lanier]|nr:MAG: hypothetical protein BTM33_01720 [Synechococcus sp. Lanier]
MANARETKLDGNECSSEVVSMEAEVPEALFQSMRDFLKEHPQWDQYQLVSSAVASFLFQNGSTDKAVAQHYLNGIFNI